jgi:hypothetical protein
LNRLLAYIGHLLLVLVGFACASLAASAFLVLLIISPMDLSAADLPPVVTGSLLVAVPFVALFVGYFAFGPGLAGILVIEALALRDWLSNAIVGGLVGLAVNLLGVWAVPDGAATHPVGSASFMLAFAAAGIIGGMAYWAIAGRAAGGWRSAALPRPPAPPHQKV